MTIKYSPANGLNDINFLSIAFTADQALVQTHVGILYNDTDDNTFLLHFAGYKDLIKESPSTDYIWIDVILTPTQKQILALICEDIYDKNKVSIPYDIEIEESCFDEKSAFVTEKDFGGLTCATFVMQMFSRAGIELIDKNTWPVRIDDYEWFLKVILSTGKNFIKLSSKNTYLKQKVEAIAQGLQRFKPVEVMAASNLPNYPNSFSTIEPHSKTILSQIQKLTSGI